MTRTPEETYHVGVGQHAFFPIMSGRGEPGAWVPWQVFAPHEAQALANHGQDLRTLAGRGGLDPTEAVAVLEGLRWPPNMTVGEAWGRIFNAAIREAAEAERESLATLIERRAKRYRSNATFPAYCLEAMAQEADEIAATVRARSDPAREGG